MLTVRGTIPVLRVNQAIDDANNPFRIFPDPPNGGGLRFEIVQGALAEGLNLDPLTGHITGTPTEEGEYTACIIRCTDVNGEYGQTRLHYKVEA